MWWRALVCCCRTKAALRGGDNAAMHKTGWVFLKGTPSQSAHMVLCRVWRGDVCFDDNTTAVVAAVNDNRVGDHSNVQ